MHEPETRRREEEMRRKGNEEADFGATGEPWSGEDV